MDTSITWKKSGIPIAKTINRHRSFQSSLSIDLDDSAETESNMSYPFQNNDKKPPSRVTQMVSRFSDNKISSSINKVDVPSQGMNKMIQRRFSENREEKFITENDSDVKSGPWKEKADSLIKMLDSEKKERERLEDVNQKLNHVIKSLNSQRPEIKEAKEQNSKIRKTLDNILPDTFKRDGPQRMISMPEIVSPKELEYLINEIETLKSNYSNLELQLYEANEKISDMIEQKQHLEQENRRLTLENAEFNKVAQLVTDNMKESIDTNKRMDETFYRVKVQRDELIKANRDSCDGPVTSPGINSDVKKLKADLEIQEAKYKAQFIEYQKTMEAELEKNTNEQISKYQVQLAVMEKDLVDVLERAENAEKELCEMRKLLREPSAIDSGPLSAPPPPPPPPPPAMPKFQSGKLLNGPTKANFQTSTLGSSIASHQLHPHEPLTSQKQSTGLDAVIDDLKNGRATLRRRKISANQSSSTNNKMNPILKEMYELLEKSRRRNRNSKLIIDNESLSFDFNIQELNI